MKKDHPWPPLQSHELLPAPLGLRADIKDLERLWLETSCYYAVFDDNVMQDEVWDKLAVELWQRKLELSPYFTHSLNLPWPVPADYGEEGSFHEFAKQENPLKTASGINWEEGLPAIVVEGIIKEGPKRLAMWRARIGKIVREAEKRDRGWLYDREAVNA